MQIKNTDFFLSVLIGKLSKLDRFKRCIVFLTENLSVAKLSINGLWSMNFSVY
jgi:hypothetical protein